MNRTKMGGAAMLAVMVAVGGGELFAQQGRSAEPRARADVMDRAARGGGAPGVEAILRLRERLELTDEQVARLDAIRGERVARHASSAAEMNELRSQLRAGTLDRVEARERMQSLREARREGAAGDRTEVEGLLSEDQRATLQQLHAQRRAFEAGRRSAMREQGRDARGSGDRTRRPGARRGPGGGR